MGPTGLYIETSAWNFLLADDAPDRKEATTWFFQHAKPPGFLLFVSRLVPIEMARTHDRQRRQLLLAQIAQYSPKMLPVSPEAESLAERYVLQGTIPEKYRTDALHVAVAVVHRLDAVVSWNMQHLVKMKTRREVNALNQLNGFHAIEIVTPEEVL